MLTKDILRKGAGQIMNKLKEAITGTAAKAADRYAIDVLGIPSLELMERASRHVTDLILRSFPPVSDKSRIYVTILCSVGNNGADGMAAARLLLAAAYVCHRQHIPRIVLVLLVVRRLFRTKGLRPVLRHYGYSFGVCSANDR